MLVFAFQRVNEFNLSKTLTMDKLVSQKSTWPTNPKVTSSVFTKPVSIKPLTFGHGLWFTSLGVMGFATFGFTLVFSGS